MFINVIFPMQRYYIFLNYNFFLPRHVDNPQTAITDFAPELMRTNIRDISKRVKHTKCVPPYTPGVSEPHIGCVLADTPSVFDRGHLPLRHIIFYGIASRDENA